MRALIGSVFHLSTAAALFTMQQAQNAVLAPLNTQAALQSLCRALDAMSDTLASKLDTPKRDAFETMTRAQSEFLWLTPQAPRPGSTAESAQEAARAATA